VGRRRGGPNSFFEFNQLFEIYSFFENTQNVTRFVFYSIFTFSIISYSNIHINFKIKIKIQYNNHSKYDPVRFLFDFRSLHP